MSRWYSSSLAALSTSRGSNDWRMSPIATATGDPYKTAEEFSTLNESMNSGVTLHDEMGDASRQLRRKKANINKSSCKTTVLIPSLCLRHEIDKHEIASLRSVVLTTRVVLTLRFYTVIDVKSTALPSVVSPPACCCCWLARLAKYTILNCATNLSYVIKRNSWSLLFKKHVCVVSLCLTSAIRS